MRTSKPAAVNKVKASLEHTCGDMLPGTYVYQWKCKSCRVNNPEITKLRQSSSEKANQNLKATLLVTALDVSDVVLCYLSQATKVACTVWSSPWPGQEHHLPIPVLGLSAFSGVSCAFKPFSIFYIYWSWQTIYMLLLLHPTLALVSASLCSDSLSHLWSGQSKSSCPDGWSLFSACELAAPQKPLQAHPPYFPCLAPHLLTSLTISLTAGEGPVGFIFFVLLMNSCCWRYFCSRLSLCNTVLWPAGGILRDTVGLAKEDLVVFILELSVWKKKKEYHAQPG